MHNTLLTYVPTQECKYILLINESQMRYHVKTFTLRVITLAVKTVILQFMTQAVNVYFIWIH